MVPRPKLNVSSREILGKKVKKLRQEGLTPAHIYGKDIKPINISVDSKAFSTIFRDVGETGLIDLVFGQQKPRPVLVDALQLHPVSGEPLHIDFHQVALTEKVKAEVPIEIVGEAPAVAEKKGVLLTILDTLEVEALPPDLPEALKVDVSRLSEVNETLKVSDLVINEKKIEVLAGPDEILVKIGPLITAEMEEELRAEKEVAAETAEEAVEEVEKEKKEEKVEGREEKEKVAPEETKVKEAV
jgi:large subunit ribosomal protein L25